jgi:hypothetical protein
VAKRHKHASASASVSTRLEPAKVAEIAEAAAKQAETIQVSVRLEQSAPGRLVYSARNRLVGGAVEFMTFEVTLKETDGVRNVRTRILTYKQVRNWVFVIPLPWRMVAWSTYRSFMYSLVSGITRHDATAKSNVLETAPA